MQDVLKVLSLARTALSDPAGLPESAPYVDPEDPSEDPWVETAIALIDRAIGLLDVEDNPLIALRTIGKLLVEISDQEADKLDDGGDGQENACDLNQALDLIDTVIARMARP